MNVLLVGGGPTSGASCMRADQLGAALRARVHTKHIDPSAADVDWADVIVIVKRLKKRFANWTARLKGLRKPVVWDALDFWKQPDTNAMLGPEMVEYCRKTRAAVGGRHVVAATEAMAADVGGVCLPHHHRLGLTPRPVRLKLRTVGYEGSERYLVGWRPGIEAICAARGWQFAVNPPHLSDADVVLALRGGDWDGWACRRWKSGVKYANALAAGRPVVTQPSAAFDEIGPPGTAVETHEELAAALDSWADYDRRRAASKQAARLAPAYHVDAIAARYRAILAGFL